MKMSEGPESLDVCLLVYTNLGICVSIFLSFTQNNFYDVKLKSVTSYWRVRLGKGQGQSLGEHRLKSRPQQSWLKTVNMLAGNLENLRAVLVFIISVHIIEPQSKQRL